MLEKHELPNFSDGENAFWSRISPDITAVLKEMEKTEDWVYYSDELPELFERTAMILPMLMPLDSNKQEKIESILDDIIIVMSVMPFRQSIYGLAWLETHSHDEFGWGLRMYDQAKENLERYTPGEVLYDSSHVLSTRVDVLTKVDIAYKVFCSPMDVFKDKEEL